MLFTGKEILSKFEKYLERATRVRIATAWATPGKALNGLEAVVQKNKRLKVCAIVGTHGNVTDPAALERLKKLGKLRLARNATLFHPKIYIFEFGSGKPVAWVGSANFTGPGFENRNVETVYETKDIEPFLEWFRQQWRQSERATKEAIDDYRKRRKKDPPSRMFPEVGEPEGTAPEPSLSPEEQNWKPVCDPEEIRAAFDQMRETLTDRPGRKKVIMRNGTTVYWRTDLRYWCDFADPDARREQGRHGYWNGFGLANPKGRQTLPPIIIELNPPFDGNSRYARKCTGLFVRNDRGGIFLARDLKGIRKSRKGRKGRGRVNPKKLEKELKKRLPGSVVDVPWREDRTRRMVVLGEVGSGGLRKTVAELVRLVAELKGVGTGAGETP